MSIRYNILTEQLLDIRLRLLSGGYKMKALMGNIAKQIRKDIKGRIELQKFIGSGEDSRVIKLSNGKSYVITSEKRTTEDEKESETTA